MTAPGWLTARPIAHRGLHDRAANRPENSVAAALAAVEAGYGIECDIQLAADGEAVVFHDFALERLTEGSGRVVDRTASELGRLTLAGSPERISALSDFLDAIGGRVPVVIEVKSRFDGDERLTRRAVEVLAGRTAPIALKSFDPEIVSLLRRIAPAVPLGIVAQSAYEEGEWARLDPARRRAMANLLHWSDTQPDFLSWHHRDLPCGPPHLARILAGAPVMTWTVGSVEEARRARLHADQIVFEGFDPG